MKIADIQPALFERFKHILRVNKLSHAYLFSGGFGSFDMAIWLSQAIFCENLQDNLPCENCRHCRLVARDEFSDLHIIRPEGQTIKTGQIRDLSEVFSQSGFEGAQKVVIITEAEKMHSNAANALLKSIEEPDNATHVFLLTENDNLILPTIKSRAQVFSFPKNSAYMQEILEQNGVLKTQAELLSRICNSVEEAQDLSGATWFNDTLKKLQQLLKLVRTDQREAFLYLTNVAENIEDKEKQSLVFSLILELFNQEMMPDWVQKTFQAEKMWKSNVRFGSCLEYIVLK